MSVLPYSCHHTALLVFFFLKYTHTHKKADQQKIVLVNMYLGLAFSHILFADYIFLLGEFSFFTLLTNLWESFFFFFFLFMATPEAYGSSQTRGPIRAAATSLCHSDARSEPHL